MRELKKNISIFIIGAIGYGLIEALYRGFTHWTMLITGGVVFVVLYHVYTKNEKAPLWQKCLAGAFIITSLELAAGCIVNLWLGWNVWDYSAYSFNFLGQICLVFTFIWFLLCIPLSYFTAYLHSKRFHID
ncbi:MAG: hypothetical protein PHE79_07370 [Eubacteriales bacterium]|nr:hypothetical protein [Eubacteriales bacterium]